MRFVLFYLVFALTLFIPPYAYAEFADDQPMNRCFVYAKEKQKIIDCLKSDSEAIDLERVVVENEAEAFLDARTSDLHSPEMRLSDVKNLKLSRKYFEEYMERECSNHQTFSRDDRTEALYAYYFCRYKMSSDRIRTLEDLMR